MNALSFGIFILTVCILSFFADFGLKLYRGWRDSQDVQLDDDIFGQQLDDRLERDNRPPTHSLQGQKAFNPETIEW